MTVNALGLTMESNGIRILEPFDMSIKYSNASGKTNIHLAVSDIFMNFSFSILRLFLAVEEDILAFLRTASKEMTVVCSQFDRVGKIISMLRYTWFLCCPAHTWCLLYNIYICINEFVRSFAWLTYGLSVLYRF